MKDGTVFVTKNRKSDDLFSNTLGNLIEYFTGMPYVHVEVWCKGHRYGSVKGGPRKTTTVPNRNGTVFLQPREELTEKQKEAMNEYLERMLSRPYNVFKLVSLALVYPTRWFWNWIGWVPFEKDVFGVVCSVYVDEAYKAAGIDLLPGRSEEYTSPGDFLKSELLEKV